MAKSRVRQSTEATRKNHGRIIKITDRFGEWFYVLLDKDGQFVDKSWDFNRLHSLLWK